MLSLLLSAWPLGLWPVHLQDMSRGANFLRGIVPVAGGPLTALAVFSMLPLARISCNNALGAGTGAGGASFLMYEVKI